MDAQSIYQLVQSLNKDVDYVSMKPSSARRIKAKVGKLFEETKKYGIELAASVAAEYDALSNHPYLVSECILGKLNVLKGKPRKNEHATAVLGAILKIEQKLTSLEGTVRFMTRHTNSKRSTGRRL